MCKEGDSKRVRAKKWKVEYRNLIEDNITDFSLSIDVENFERYLTPRTPQSLTNSFRKVFRGLLERLVSQKRDGE